MAKYVYLYSGGSMAETPEEQESSMQAWGAWFGTLGGALIDGGNPFAASSTISADGSVSAAGTSSISGYTLINADSLDAAVTSAKDCPVLTTGGSVEVYEAIDM